MQPVKVFLGEEFDAEGEEIDKPAVERRPDSFAATYQQFLNHIDTNRELMQFKAFERHLDLLCITTKTLKVGGTALNILS